MATMNVSLTEEMVEYVSGEVASGDYGSASELVRDALRLLRREREIEREKLEVLRREIAIGMEQAERGEFSTQTIDEIAAEVLGPD